MHGATPGGAAVAGGAGAVVGTMVVGATVELVVVAAVVDVATEVDDALVVDDAVDVVDPSVDGGEPDDEVEDEHAPRATTAASSNGCTMRFMPTACTIGAARGQRVPGSARTGVSAASGRCVRRR